MDITAISDLHGHYPKLEGGDLLIVAGDLTTTGEHHSYYEFCSWLERQDYEEKIIVAGNHDNGLVNGYEGVKYGFDFSGWATYLCDSGTEFVFYENCESEKTNGPIYDVQHVTQKKLKIWGSPWTKTFPGMNPKCKAFTCDTEEELAEKWALIPDDVDILVTHGPPASMLDWNKHGENCGSRSLLMRATNLPNLKLLVFGHVHECYGQYHREEFVEFANDYEKIFGPPKCKSMPHIVNASHVNERYEPVNKPIRIVV